MSTSALVNRTSQRRFEPLGPEEHAAELVKRITCASVGSPLQLPRLAALASSTRGRLLPLELLVEARVALAQRRNLRVSELDVSYPQAHRGDGNVQSRGDRLDRLALLDADSTGFLALRNLHEHMFARRPDGSA